MTEEPHSNVRLAGQVLDHVDENEVAPLIMDMAGERLRSQQAMSIALDARIAQVCSVLFTAAAVAAALAAVEGDRPVRLFAAMGALVFAIAGTVAFTATRSETYSAGGLEPAWWQGALSEPEFDLRVARSWAAQQMQIAIEANLESDRNRGWWLNVSLGLGALAAFLLAAAAISRAIA